LGYKVPYDQGEHWKKVEHKNGSFTILAEGIEENANPIFEAALHSGKYKANVERLAAEKKAGKYKKQYRRGGLVRKNTYRRGGAVSGNGYRKNKAFQKKTQIP